ncbi:MAG: hypothetical protein KJ063_06890 [Anaerolineae bacterium]|nr:hypothetical protein [Anaerolineae bacterium]
MQRLYHPTPMKIRPKFRCWQCEQEYTLFREVDEGLKLLVACPYCGAEGELDLGRYLRPTAITIYRSSDKPPLTLELFDLPEVLPTQPRTQSGESS